MKKITTEYNVSSLVLYKICVAVWGFCRDNLQAFADLKALYTEAFIADALQAVQDAKDLPASRTTIGDRKTARENLVKATDVVMADWRQLKIYITNAFDKTMAPIKLEMAGASLYKKASYDNWNSVAALIDAANNFTESNIKALTLNNNMPVSFQATLQADSENCSSLAAIFSGMEVSKQQATGRKIEANNAIYQSLMLMLRDGQHIFYQDPVIRKQFVLRYLKAIYGNDKSASLTGFIMDSNKLPLQGAVVATKDQQYTATADANGRYRIRLAEGSYTFIITCPGYVPQEKTITFIAGLGTRASFELSNAMKKVA